MMSGCILDTAVQLSGIIVSTEGGGMFRPNDVWPKDELIYSGGAYMPNTISSV